MTDNVKSLRYLPEHIRLAHSMYSDTPPRYDDPVITRAWNDYIQAPQQLAIKSKQAYSYMKPSFLLRHAPIARIPLHLPRQSSLDSSHHFCPAEPALLTPPQSDKIVFQA